MNRNILRLMASARKPFIRIITVDGCEVTPWIEILWEMGLRIYNNPYGSDDSTRESYIISSKKLTYEWYIKNCERLYGRKIKRWADKELAAWHQINEELDEAN